MNERSRNIAVGLTAIAGLIGFGVLLMLFGWVPAWAEEGYLVRVQLPSASGVSLDSRVRMAGIDIGRVTDVQLQDPPSRGVVISASIREEIQIPRQARVQVESPLIGGSPALTFDVSELDPEQEIAYLPQDGSAMVQGQATTLASQLAGELQAAMAEPTRQFQRVATSFAELSHEWTQVGARLNAMLEPRTFAQVEAGQVQPNLTTIIARADQRLAELEKVTAGLNTWLSDEELRTNLREAVANARAASEALATTAKNVDELTAGAGENLQTLTRRYVAVADDMSAAITSMRQVLSKANEGEGTVGKLLNDPQLYNNLNDAVTRLNAALREIRQLAEKFRTEGLPVRF